MSAAQGVLVAPILLDCLADRLCDVEIAIQSISQALKGKSRPNGRPFIADALLMALSEKLSRCFEALDEVVLSRPESQLAEVAHAARA
jgi:hypothetical protein